MALAGACVMADESVRRSFLLGRNLIEALTEAGLADDRTSRVTIDIPVNDLVRVYIERYGDKRLLSIVPALAENGVQIERIDQPDEQEKPIEGPENYQY